MKITKTTIELVLTNKEIKDLQKDLGYIIYMKEIPLSKIGQEIIKL